MIRTERLGKQFDTSVAVNGLSLEVAPGELLALLGPNGAGKTTTVRLLSAILQPTQGRAWVNNHDILTEADQVRRSIGVLTEQSGLYRRMTGLDYLLFYGRLYGLDDRRIQQRANALYERFNVSARPEQPLGEYSRGMQQKIGLIRALLHDPAVLLLDEPTSAMDPRSTRLVRDAIRELRADNRTIILCTHNLAEAETLADRIAIINHGRIVAHGTLEELKRHFLGPPQFEVHLEQPVDDPQQLLSDLVPVELVAPRILRYLTSSPESVNPELVRRLLSVDRSIVSLESVPRNLEEVYLQVVGGQTGPYHSHLRD